MRVSRCDQRATIKQLMTCCCPLFTSFHVAVECVFMVENKRKTNRFHLNIYMIFIRLRYAHVIHSMWPAGRCTTLEFNIDHSNAVPKRSRIRRIRKTIFNDFVTDWHNINMKRVKTTKKTQQQHRGKKCSSNIGKNWVDWFYVRCVVLLNVFVFLLTSPSGKILR